MKTRTIFEPSDFEACGQMIVRNSSTPDSDDISFRCSVSYKIGWIINAEKGNSVCMISLTDGMIANLGTVEKLCDRLNNDHFGFRPLTVTEMAEMVQYLGNRFY